MSYVANRYGDFIARVFRRTLELVDQRLDPRLREEADWHLSTLERSKGVRPALVEAAAEMSGWIDDSVVDNAAAVQLVHEAMLIADDVFDESPRRRGKTTLFAQFGRIRATVTGWAFLTLAGEIFDHDSELRSAVRAITMRGCIAEAMQEKHRFTQRPLAIEVWKEIALGDTGGIFDLAIAAGGIRPEGFWFGETITFLRHGLDDVDDLLDPNGDQADVRDRVPTLLSCFAQGTKYEDLLTAVPMALTWLESLTNVHMLDQLPARWREPLLPFLLDFRTMWGELQQAQGLML